MPSPPVPPSTVRFVEFTADLETRELFRNGSKIRLQGQPFEVLAVLLEHPGRLVTRDELRQRLWPADSFVDFDHGLNAAVNVCATPSAMMPTIPNSSKRFHGAGTNSSAQLMDSPKEPP